jgi:cyclic beta-1,2-glucan synthetase
LKDPNQKTDIFSAEKLEEYSIDLAKKLDINQPAKFCPKLFSQIRSHRKLLLKSYRSLSKSIQTKDALPHTVEWLVDNFHIVESQFRQLQRDMTPALYKKLPKLSSGDLIGSSRVYGLVKGLLAHTDNQLEAETLFRFVQAFQKNTPLDIAELWALSPILKLVLIENLSLISEQTARNFEKRAEANELFDKLRENLGNEQNFSRLIAKIPTFCVQRVQNEHAFISQFAKRLRDQDSRYEPVLKTLEKFLTAQNFTIESIVHIDHQAQAAHQVSVANIITSMRLLSSLEWPAFIESESLIDRVLEADPEGSYRQMDAETKNQYRERVAELAIQNGVSEVRAAKKVLSLANDSKIKEPQDWVKYHVGYYLMGEGCLVNQNPFHGLITRLRGLARIARHDRLPKLDLSSGVPANGRTLIVIFARLTSERTVGEILEKIEVHYLANNDPQFSFAILSESDDLLSKVISEGILKLNQKYLRKNLARKTEPLFFCFKLSSAKPARLEKRRELKLLFRNTQNDFLRSVKFVFTVGTDTKLPRNVVRRLVGTALHPLNRYFYSVIQPKVSPSPEAPPQFYFFTPEFHDAGHSLYRVDALEVLPRMAFASEIEIFDQHPFHQLAQLMKWIKDIFKRRKISLNEEGRQTLRQIARRTWNYFDTFVKEEENSLPPDNYQEDPKPTLAHRTSPTNMGVYLLSLVSARDLGYLTPSTFIRRLSATLDSMKKLEQFNGHFYNWYDTQTLRPLQPKYISTADSGNLAGHLLAVKQACLEISNTGVMNRAAIAGLNDTLSLMKPEQPSKAFLLCKTILSAPIPTFFSEWSVLLTALSEPVKILRSESAHDQSRWCDALILQVEALQKDLKTFAPWTIETFPKINDSHVTLLLKVLDQSSTFFSLSCAYDQAISSLEQDFAAKQEWIDAFKAAKAKTLQSIDMSEHLAQDFANIFEAMNFGFLLDHDRGIFSIGYNVAESKHDSGFYDLLASESRLASFVAIAKGDVPQKHWFKLGRERISTQNGRALISWSASMFEYLMPLLVMRTYAKSLLDETYNTVLLKQMSYGKAHHTPWGISEAGFNARDVELNYQYGPFGIPGLGFKRGLGRDLVVSPYSTLLAAIVNPVATLKNLQWFIRQKLLTNYGFYESIDYTAERVPENQDFATIKSFMAHHQGMSLVAINNVINQNIIQNRFHREPCVKAAELLLQERIPREKVPLLSQTTEREFNLDTSASVNPGVRHYQDPNRTTPLVQLLSNDHYTVMISTAGAGYSQYGKVAMTRWSEDSTRDQWGSYIFIKNIASKLAWSTTYQPSTQVIPKSYQVTFREDKVDFERRDGDISTHTEILVSSEKNVEIRHVTLTNHSTEPCTLEITSYLEPVLAPLANDLDHPAFSKLFIQTEWFPSGNALFANRRKQSDDEKEFWGIHVVACDKAFVTEIQYETNREHFIGRGRTIQNPISIFDGKDLSNTVGATLDPILSLRCRINLAPGEIARVAFATGIASSREEAIELSDRYHDIHYFDRESTLAWTKSQVDLRHLNIDSESAYLFQRMAEKILYFEPRDAAMIRPLKPSPHMQLNLWAHGISGDLPMAVISIKDPRDFSVIHKLLRCHEYLRLKGLIYDFIILNEQDQTYVQELQEALQEQIRITGSESWLNKPGGVFILRSDLTPLEHRTFIQSLARVSLFADIPLKDQIDVKLTPEKYPPSFHPSEKKQNYPVQDLPIPKTDFFNEFGGFNNLNQEYIIALGAGLWTPAPWVNVIGNQNEFGFQVSETGSGFTWSINSQINRLTPWSNDPVSDPSGEIIYLRDEETGEVWTPTPLPIRGLSNYIVKHGQGYTSFDHVNLGFHSTLTSFVPKNDSVKISILKIKNLTDQKRRISVTSYTEWVLGTQKQKSSSHLTCDIDSASGALFAQNSYEDEFAGRVAFADMSGSNQRTFTCSRKEFLGRNGNYSEPAALKRKGLSGKSGTSEDPCAALQSTFEFAPDEEHEIIILLGQCADSEKARELSLRYRQSDLANHAFIEVTKSWRSLINTIQVKTPDSALDTLMNSWLFYQVLSCRFWSRTAFYQSGGAYGFRDQLQDCMAFVYSAPDLAREHILRASGRQFKEGDVQHWWHPPTGRGIRTRMSDDLVWLPFVVSFYVKVTGDHSVLHEMVPFIKAPLLNPDQKDSYTLPEISSESVTVFDHCVHAIDRASSLGVHGLPLMGTGDWNDSMNRVGAGGKGESIWLGWFLYKAIQDFLPFCNEPEPSTRKKDYELRLKDLKQALELNGWDGEWYRRAYFDDGTPLGSSTNEECKIDSIAQTWAVLSGASDPLRAAKAMEKVEEFLIQKDLKLILLLTPAFNKSKADPGYIKGYVPGVRENGGQYTHAAVWAIMAYAQMGNGNKAMECFNLLNPIHHSLNKMNAEKYKIEPYVLAGDVYAGSPHEGCGGWSWYTGSASWYYRAGLESILGFHLQGKKLKIEPCIPNTWKSYEIIYTFGNTKYSIQVENPLALNQGTSIIHLDGALVNNSELELFDDKKEHLISVTLVSEVKRVAS